MAIVQRPDSTNELSLASVAGLDFTPDQIHQDWVSISKAMREHFKLTQNLLS